MRVISGSCRGQRLKAPRGLDTRPTQDRVREAIFNVLGPRVVDSLVLDVFAGSGALGIEALSRGAAEAVFIEASRASWSIIKGNLTKTGLHEKAQVMLGDFAALLPRLNKGFDLIFLDPPYKKDLAAKAFALILSQGLLKKSGLIILETGAKDGKLPELPSDTQITLIKKSIYGDTAIVYYQYN